MTKFLILSLNGLANGAILALTALGFVLIYKATEVINFAQGQFLVVGAFLVYNANVTWGWPPWASVLFGIAGGIILGMAVERVILRRLVGEATLSVIMVTIGLASTLAGLVLYMWGAEPKPRPEFIPNGRVTFGEVGVSADRLWAMAVAAIVLVVVGFFFQKSRHGVAMRAVADDQQAAMVQGISVNRVFAIAWAMAGAAGAIGGVLLASMSGGYDLVLLESFAIFVFPVVILGGLDSILGTVVGGVIVGLLVEYSKGYMDGKLGMTGSDFAQILPFVVLVAILLVKPYGLFGQVKIERV